MDASADVLLHELRRGERDAFVRYHALFRAPVYDLVWRLAGDQDAAVALTDEAFATAYSRILLRDGRIDLRGCTYRAALDICRDQLAGIEMGDASACAGGGDMPAARLGSAPKDLGRRVAQAFGSLAFEHRAVLLLHDIHGLTASETATAFGLTEDAAGALLFKAREAFRGLFEDLSNGKSGGACRLAELAAAGAVGRGLSPDEALRLEDHAGYCRHCRRVVKAWGTGPVGLALFLEEAALPPALETPPVFAVRASITAPSGAAAATLVSRAFARGARSVKGRTFAYVIAAACLALSLGLAAQLSLGDRDVVVIQSAGLSLPWIHPAKSAPASASAGRRTTSTAGVRTSAGTKAASSGTSSQNELASASPVGEPDPAAPAVAAATAPSSAARPAARPAADKAGSGGEHPVVVSPSPFALASSTAGESHGRAAKAAAAPRSAHGSAGSRAATGRRPGGRAARPHPSSDGRRHGDHMAKGVQVRAARTPHDHAARPSGGKAGKKHR